MSKLFLDLNIYSYDRYLKSFEQWVKNVESSTAGASENLVEYTKLNWTRTQRIHKTLSLHPALTAAVKEMKHTYTWIVLTEAWCGDSAQNLPVIAAIAALNPEKIKLHILLREENPELMNQYLTNGSRAIPKLIAIDEVLAREAFVWGPRPAPAQHILNAWKKDPDGKSWEDFEKELHGWYAKDKFETIQAEFLKLLQGL